MYSINKSVVLAGVFLFGPLLADVFLDAVVKDRTNAEGLILLDQRPDGLVVLARYKLTIKRHLHELIEGSLAHDLLTEIHNLNRKERTL